MATPNEKFDFDLLHRAGIIHQPVDELSKLSTEASDKKEINDYIPKFTDEDKPPRIVIACFECDTPKDVASEEAKAIFIEAEKQEKIIDEVEFLAEQGEDDFCNQMSLTVGTTNSAFSYDKDGFLVLLSPTDGAVQLLAPATFRELMLRISNFPTVEGNPGSRKK